MINKHCHKEFAVEMRRNCNSDQGGNVFQPEPAFCKQVEKCIKNWRKMYKDKGEAQVEVSLGRSLSLRFKGLFLYTVGILFHAVSCIRQLWCSSIILCNITGMAYNHFTDISPL